MSKGKKLEVKKEIVIYCGASLSNGVLQQYTIFKNGFPKHLEEHIEACSAIKALMVDVEKLAETRKNISIMGTRENKQFNKIIEYAKGVK